MQLDAPLRLVSRLGLLQLVILSLHSVQAGSATWDINPTNDWNTAGNWTPDTVPNSPVDIATFANTNMPSPVIHSRVEVNAIVLDPRLGIDITITAGEASSDDVTSLTISGTGIVNNSSGLFEKVQAASTLAANGARNVIFMTKSATVTGSPASLLANGGVSPDSVGGQIQFLDNSTAAGPGVGTGVIAQAGLNGGGAGESWFFDNSSAGNGDIESLASGAGSTPGFTVFAGTSTAGDAFVGNQGASAAGVEGGKTFFLESSTAGDAILEALSGAQEPGAGGSGVIFSDTTTAGNALLEGLGFSVGEPGFFQFLSDSTGGTAQVEITGNANLTISDHNPPGVTIGSIGGTGTVILGSNNLTVGRNDLSTDFSGVIEGSGSLTKIGTGILALGGSSTYTGVTAVTDGVLRVTNAAGSGTGAGALKIRAGTLAGDGIIGGPVTLRAGAFLAPSIGALRDERHRLTIQSTLSFLADATYSCQFDINKRVADQVLAHGVKIASGAHFVIIAKGNKQLPLGATFVVIVNTSANPISGTFDNLADGAIVTVNGNKFQASYTGANGNDLTLTVVP